MNNENREKLLNLLADQAIFGLNETEAAELENLKREFPEFQADDSFEMAAAAMNLSFLQMPEQMPTQLQSKVLSQADAYFNQSENISRPENLASTAPISQIETPRIGVIDSSSEQKLPWWGWLGWGVAALASIALAVNLFISSQNTKNTEIVQNPISTPTPTPEPSNQQKREQMMASAKDAVQASWKEADPKSGDKITGDVVWSDAEQKGFVRFSGLPANDPAKETYQLWIFDENQSEKYPVDGGVFNVSANGEVIVPIDAKINVKKPKMFAVTKERPGGVVVSDRQRMVALAKMQI